MDPNKYAKNKKLKPSSPIDLVRSIAEFVLIIFGIAGLAYEFFRESSIVTKFIASLFESYTSMLLIPVIGVAFWLFSNWTSSPKASENPEVGNIPMYVMMAIGAFYLFRLISTGHF
jgi:hypothetical protein